MEKKLDICRMDNTKPMKQVVFGMIDGAGIIEVGIDQTENGCL